MNICYIRMLAYNYQKLWHNYTQEGLNHLLLLWMLCAGLSLVHCEINLSWTKVGLQFSINGWDVHVRLPDLHDPLFYWLPIPCHYTMTFIFIFDIHYCKVGLFMNYKVFFFYRQWMSTCQKIEWHSRTRGMDLWSSWEKKMQIMQSK